MKGNMQLIGIAIVILVVIAGGLSYVFLFSQPGIEFSCDSKEIIGFKRVPPPAMAIIQPTICKVTFEAKIGLDVLCSGEKQPILNNERGVFACAKLNDHLNEMIEIKAIFFDEDGNQISNEKSKTIPYEGF